MHPLHASWGTAAARRQSDMKGGRGGQDGAEVPVSLGYTRVLWYVFLEQQQGVGKGLMGTLPFGRSTRPCLRVRPHHSSNIDYRTSGGSIKGRSALSRPPPQALRSARFELPSGSLHPLVSSNDSVKIEEVQGEPAFWLCPVRNNSEGRRCSTLSVVLTGQPVAHLLRSIIK